eukprot:GHRR01010552.1.p2 GENE.GHRR01010552.1~~GHRR01010552.1.p2  ORF type:complete len:117 (-),score=16.54 GHRR01010552.1:2487-2837(-)
MCRHWWKVTANAAQQLHSSGASLVAAQHCGAYGVLLSESGAPAYYYCTVSLTVSHLPSAAGDKKDLEARCEQIRQAMENTTSDYDREKLQERLAKLSGRGEHRFERIRPSCVSCGA